MEEKKLTDEEIVKALECCIKGVTVSNCAECPLDMIEEDCCYYTPTLIDRYALDLIHRLQKENEELKSPKFASWKLKFFNLKEEFDKELAEHEEFTKKAKDEIERLTEWKDKLQDTKDELEQQLIDTGFKEYCEENAELRKQVDELKEERENMQAVIFGLEEDKRLLQKQVDELKEQLKSVQSACQSKNAKIKNLNAEKEALQNELNFQNGKPHYRYVIWNTKRNERQFPSICELTESGAYTKLFQKIGWDSAKYRFVVKRIKVDGVEVE